MSSNRQKILTERFGNQLGYPELAPIAGILATQVAKDKEFVDKGMKQLNDCLDRIGQGENVWINPVMVELLYHYIAQNPTYLHVRAMIRLGYKTYPNEDHIIILPNGKNSPRFDDKEVMSLVRMIRERS